MTAAVARSVPAKLLHDQITALGVTHVVTVPDTHQRTLLASLATDPALRLLTVATEDEAICVNAGLWMGGAEPLLLVQNLGIFAAMNSLRGIAIDTKVPTCMLTGQFLRDVGRPAEDNAASGVRLIGPMLQALGVPVYPIEGPEDASLLSQAFFESRERRGPTVALVGAPTS
jgi:sulfopyruvate decarboxylase TPP-binding subunit